MRLRKRKWIVLFSLISCLGFFKSYGGNPAKTSLEINTGCNYHHSCQQLKSHPTFVFDKNISFAYGSDGDEFIAHFGINQKINGLVQFDFGSLLGNLTANQAFSDGDIELRKIVFYGYSSSNSPEGKFTLVINGNTMDVDHLIPGLGVYDLYPGGLNEIGRNLMNANVVLQGDLLLTAADVVIAFEGNSQAICNPLDSIYFVAPKMTYHPITQGCDFDNMTFQNQCWKEQQVSNVSNQVNIKIDCNQSSPKTVSSSYKTDVVVPMTPISSVEPMVQIISEEINHSFSGREIIPIEDIFLLSLEYPSRVLDNISLNVHGNSKIYLEVNKEIVDSVNISNSTPSEIYFRLPTNRNIIGENLSSVNLIVDGDVTIGTMNLGIKN